MRALRGTLNRVELIGWMGEAPDQRQLASGAMVCTLSIATRRAKPRNEQGDRTFDTDWTTVEVWDRLAEQCTRSLHKGSRVRIVGALHTTSWEDRETGQRRFRTYVRAGEVMFLDSRTESNGTDLVEAELTEDAEESPA